MRIKPMKLLSQLLTVVAALIIGTVVWAGPPFVTDDPEPVELHHWEAYIASQYIHDDVGVAMTAPHLEVNYGALPDTQLHLIVPLVYSSPKDGSKQYGLGDIELGVKYRFIHETEIMPQVGTFPIVLTSTGSESRGLGEGHTKVFIPIWLQKSWGPWTTYGGGYWFNHSADNKNFWQTGWEVQRAMSKTITIGAELFNMSPAARGESDRSGFNIGAIINFSEEHHLLLSAGRDFGGPDNFTSYVAYQWTFGPEEKKEKQARLMSLYP